MCPSPAAAHIVHALRRPEPISSGSLVAGPVGPATILVLELVPKFDGVRISKGSNPSLASSYATRLGGEDTETRDRDIV